MKLLPLILLAAPLFAQAPPKIPFDSDMEFLKLPADMNFGEVLGIAINSKGQIVVLNHPGSSTSGPLYGNATTQLLAFDPTGKFLHEIGRNVYGLGYAHSVRFDKYDNLWVVDKGTMSIMRFNPAGRVTMNLGRREEGPDEHRFPAGRGGAPPVHVDGIFNGPTDIAWDSKDNMYISDGYQNSRVAKPLEQAWRLDQIMGFTWPGKRRSLSFRTTSELIARTMLWCSRSQQSSYSSL